MTAVSLIPETTHLSLAEVEEPMVTKPDEVKIKKVVNLENRACPYSRINGSPFPSRL
jgi:hypothetical protein